MSILSFCRVEKKYLITCEQQKKLMACFLKHMEYDKHCLNGSSYLIKNIFFDTKNAQMISISVSKPKFKQKLRARKYGNQNQTFLEIKKKINGVVGKRRIALSDEELLCFINDGLKPTRENYIDAQIINEISYLLTLYDIEPYAFISYDRIGFFDKNNKNFRITFDFHIHGRRQKQLDWNNYNGDDVPVVPDDMCIMEIKNDENYPFWLVELLSEEKIYPTSFSKIGTFYKKYILKEKHP